MLSVLTLDYRMNSKIQMFINVPSNDDIESAKFVTVNENITQGHSLKLNKSRCLKCFRHNAFPARCIEDWNALSKDLVYAQRNA